MNAAFRIPPFEPCQSLVAARDVGEFDVTVEQSGDIFRCAAGESVLRGMLRLGRRGIPVGCVGGGCGICRVRIRAGRVVQLGPISRAHVSADDEAAGMTLACQVAPLTPLHVEAVGYLGVKFGQSVLSTQVRTIDSTNGGK